ncbi:MAG TPA: hypothetical protein VLA90_01175 [Actinomycetota bacterium]|nr:hypothetical protein [Actinomycetota bacterium]
MAVAQEEDRLPPPPGAALGQKFTLGRPATRLHALAAGFVSFWDLLRPERREDHPPLGLTVAKMLMWIVAGVAVTSAVFLAAGVLLVRLYTGAVG